MKIKELAETMYVPGLEHVRRLEMLGKKLSGKTLNQKKQLLGKIVQTFGDCDIEDLSIKEVMQYLLDLDEERSSSWKNRYLQVFKSLYSEYNWKMQKPITVPDFPKFNSNTTQADVFSSEELKKLFDREIWQNDANFLLYYITVNCGLRLGEARGLRASQFLFDRHILIIDGFLRYDGTRTVFNKAGSLREQKQRVVFLPASVEKRVKSYIEENKLSGNDFLFVSNGKPFSPEFCERLFQKMLKKAGIEKEDRKLTPHSLRYTYITKMRRYVGVEVVQLLAGHTEAGMTDYYTKPLLEDMITKIEASREPVEKIFD